METKNQFTKKMKGICEKTITEIVGFFKDEAIEAHVFGSMAKGTNDALSDIDIWITFEDEKMTEVLANRMTSYAKFGEIVLLHEMQNNFPLNGIQTAIIYKIDGELIRVDFYLCPLSSSRVLPDSKILFEKKKIEFGNIIPETKRTPRDLTDRITFFICMCFNGIKKVVREDASFADFLTSEFKKYEKEIPKLTSVPKVASFNMIRKALAVLDTVSNPEQKAAIVEINNFLTKVESFSLINYGEILLKIQSLLGKEITEFTLKGKGAVNYAYYIETNDNNKYIVKQERNDKEFQPQNDLVVEAKVAQELHRLNLSAPIPNVVFISEDLKMYGYEYVEGDLLRSIWKDLSESEKIGICRNLVKFHAEIGQRFTKEMAVTIGIKIDMLGDLHPEVSADYDRLILDTNVPENFKTLVKEARSIFDRTQDKFVFQFLHNDSHHENIIIKEKAISGIIDFGNAEYGETAKEFSRYIRDFPDHFQHIISSYEEVSGNKLSRQRLVSNALISGFIDIVESYYKGGNDRVQAEAAIAKYKTLL